MKKTKLEKRVENVENRFWELAAAGKLTEEEVITLARKYLITDIHHTSEDICEQFENDLKPYEYVNNN